MTQPIVDSFHIHSWHLVAKWLYANTNLSNPRITRWYFILFFEGLFDYDNRTSSVILLASDFYWRNSIQIMQEYSHLCRFGDRCRKLNDPEHLRYYLHNRLPKCQDNQNCALISDWSHREKFQHDGMPCVLIPCNNGLQCPRALELAHTKVYKHVWGPAWDPV